MVRVIKTLTQANLGPFIDFVIDGIMSVFTQLQNIEFMGTNMLSFCITISIIGILLPIIFTIARGFTIPKQSLGKEKYKTYVSDTRGTNGKVIQVKKRSYK